VKTKFWQALLLLASVQTGSNNPDGRTLSSSPREARTGRGSRRGASPFVASAGLDSQNRCDASFPQPSLPRDAWKRGRRILVAFALLLALCFSAHAGTEGRDPSEIINDIRGIPHRPFDTTNKAGAVLIFYWHDCPICNAYAPEINRICAAYTNFSFYIVQVDPDLTAEKARKHAKDYGLIAPVLLDNQHHLVKLAGAKATPEAIIFVKDMNVLYRGRIDNLYPSLNKRRLTATQHDLRNALDAIASGKPIGVQRPPMGCAIQ
jgi:peroxiredoxin